MPGLQAFLSKLQDDNPIIKRELDKASGEVRVMTIHAAKGLEAPIVFLVDKCSAAFHELHAPALYEWEKPPAKGYLWVPSSSHHSNQTKKLRELEKQKAEEEYRRLLYVGMTRAEDRLIVCGYGPNSIPQPNWHGMVSKALEPEWQDVLDENGELLWHRWKAKDSPTASPWHHDLEGTAKIDGPAPLPEWINHKLPAESALPRPLTPSGAQALIDDDHVTETVIPSLLDLPMVDSIEQLNPNPRRRGIVLHKLLQVLPDLEPNTRWTVAADYLSKMLPDYTHGSHEGMLKGLQDVIDDPDLAFCFDPQHSRAEVPVMGEIELATGTRALSGIIDRMAVLEDLVVILDYKTSAWVPTDIENVPQDYLTQMALYRDIVARIYPNKPVEAALLWTHASSGPQIMQLPDTILDHALNALGGLDLHANSTTQ